MRFISIIKGDINQGGQSTLQLILPLIIIISVLLGVTLMIPRLTPIKSIALLAGMLIFFISFVSTEIALYILIFSMLLSPEFIVGATAGASLERGVTLRLDDIMLLIIGFSWLAKMSVNKELGLFATTPINRPIAFYIILCLVSTLLGVIFGRVQFKTGMLFVIKYFEYMIVYFMVVNHLDDKKQVGNYLWAMIITCAIVSIIGIAQIPGGGRISAPFEGEAGEPNTLGGYLILMISVVMGLLMTTPHLRFKLVYAMLIALFIVPFIYTQSRSSYLALAPAMLVFLWLSEKKMGIIVAILLLGISLPFITPKIAKERLSYTFTQGKNRLDTIEIGGVRLDTSSSARVLTWIDASKAWVKHPILGYGVTGYRFMDVQYVRVVIETGILGLITFFLLVVTLFRQSYHVFKEAEEPADKGLAMGFLAGFIGLLFHGIGANTFIIVRIMEPFWFIVGMVLMTQRMKNTGEGEENGKNRHHHSP